MLPLTSGPSTRLKPPFSSSHSGTHAPTRTIRTSLRLTLPPIPSISWRSYPGPSCGDGVRSFSWWNSSIRVDMGVPAPPKGDPLAAAGGVVPVPEAGEGSSAIHGAIHGVVPLSRASSASQSVSCSRSLPARQSSSRPHMTPRSPSPMPVPSPPRTSPYWFLQRQILPIRRVSYGMPTFEEVWNHTVDTRGQLL